MLCYAGGILLSWLSGGVLVVSHPDPSLLFFRLFGVRGHAKDGGGMEEMGLGVRLVLLCVCEICTALFQNMQ